MSPVVIPKQRSFVRDGTDKNIDDPRVGDIN